MRNPILVHLYHVRISIWNNQQVTFFFPWRNSP